MSSIIDYARGLLLGSAQDITAATTTDLASTTSNRVRINGNATITSFGIAPEGAHRRVRFTGTPTLVYDPTLMILPGKSNIQVVADSTAEIVSTGTGWRVFSWMNGDGKPLAPGLTLGQIIGATLGDSLGY